MDVAGGTYLLCPVSTEHVAVQPPPTVWHEEERVDGHGAQPGLRHTMTKVSCSFRFEVVSPLVTLALKKNCHLILFDHGKPQAVRGSTLLL